MFIAFSHICISINFFFAKDRDQQRYCARLGQLPSPFSRSPAAQTTTTSDNRPVPASSDSRAIYIKKSQFLRLRRKRRRVSLIFFWEWIFANLYFVFLRLESLSNVSTNRPFCVVRDDAVQIIESAFASQPVRGREVGRKTSSETEFAFR